MNRHAVLLFVCLALLVLIRVGTAARPRRLSPHVQALSAPRGMYQAARWAPNGQWIAAVFRPASRGDEYRPQVVLLRPDGTLVHTFPDPPGATEDRGVWAAALAWHPDGTLVVAADMISLAEQRSLHRPTDRHALVRIDPNDLSKPPTVLRADLPTIHAMDWSPDGQRLLMQQDRGALIPMTNSRYQGLVVYDLVNALLDEWQYHDTYLAWPRWRPDGSEVVYVGATLPGQRAPVDEELIFRAWPDGEAERVSLVPDCGLEEPSWSPDGKYILYRELCNNLNGQRVDHLVVAPRRSPRERTEVCDGRQLLGQDWGTHGQLLALTVGFYNNNLVVCEVPLTKQAP